MICKEGEKMSAKKFTNGTTGGPVMVDVEDDKIVRIYPIEFDETDAESWKIEARGKSFTPPRKTSVTPYTSGIKSLVYSNKRILKPLKRVDYKVDEGKINARNRGISGYEEISWEEALSIAANEISRVKEKYGPSALGFAHSSHQLWGNVGYWMSAWDRFKNLLGFTDITSNPDSWEGWHWGAMHTWGFSWRYGLPEQYDLLEDAMQNTELIVFWSSDPEATSGVYAAHEGTPRRFWLKELGVEMVFIDPYFNHSASLFGDKWIAPRLGTDTCLALAIAYIWIEENLYNTEFVEEKTVGFKEWKDYILGNEDGIVKSPAWAAKQCDIPEREIIALARNWGRKKTMLAAGGIGGFGGACRRSNGNEWAKMMVCLAAMQGIGNPGSNIWSTQQGTPVDTDFFFPGYSEGGISGDIKGMRRWNERMFDKGGMSGPKQSEQTLMKLAYPDAISENKSSEWYFKGVKNQQEQFIKREYPEKGKSKIKLIYRFGGSNIGTMSQSDRYASMYQKDNVECVISEAVWMEGETPYADIILPACTNFERWDISEFAHAAGYLADSFTQNNHRVITLQKKCIEPLGESKSDYWILSELSKRLGLGEVYTDGNKNEIDWVKQIFEASDLPKYITWEKFFDKGYFVVPVNSKRKKTPALKWFAEGKTCDTPDWTLVNGDMSKLQTKSGKIEFVASSLEEMEKIDENRPMLPKHISSWEGYDSEIAHKYPLQLLTPHPRFSMHSVGDGKDSFINDIEEHRILIDNHYYWIARMNPIDAAKRKLKGNDKILLYNDRGGVVCGLEISERVRPGVVHSYGSSAEYNPLGAAGNSIDIGGCVNILTSKRYITDTANGMALDCQLEVKHWDGEKTISEITKKV